MSSIEHLRRIALSLPETTERPMHGTPAFYVRTKFFARVNEGGRTAVLHVASLEEKEALLAAEPVKLTTTPHYDGHRSVLVVLAAVTEAELRELVTDSWRLRAPKMLVHDLDGRRGVDELEDVLHVLRTWPELTAKGTANFHAKGRAFLHFHQSKTSRRADVREGRDWGPPIDLPVGRLTKKDQREFLAEVRRRLDVTLAT